MSAPPSSACCRWCARVRSRARACGQYASSAAAACRIGPTRSSALWVGGSNGRGGHARLSAALCRHVMAPRILSACRRAFWQARRQAAPRKAGREPGVHARAGVPAPPVHPALPAALPQRDRDGRHDQRPAHRLWQRQRHAPGDALPSAPSLRGPQRPVSSHVVWHNLC